MPTYYNSLEQKTELAAKAVLDDASAWTIAAHAGEDDEDLDLPRAVCTVEEAEESQLGSGVWSLKLTVSLIASADDTTPTTHKTNVAKLRDLFLDDDIAATLSGKQSAFTVVGVTGRGTGKSIEERNRIAQVSLEMLAAPSNL